MFTKEMFDPLNLQQLSYLQTQGFEETRGGSVLFRKVKNNEVQQLVTFSVFPSKTHYRFYFPVDAIIKEEDRVELSLVFLQMKALFKQHPSVRLQLVTGNRSLVSIDGHACIHPAKYPLITDPFFLEEQGKRILHMYETAKKAARAQEEHDDEDSYHYILTLGGQEGELMKQFLIKNGIVKDWTGRDTLVHKRLMFTEMSVQSSSSIKQAFARELRTLGYASRLSKI